MWIFFGELKLKFSSEFLSVSGEVHKGTNTVFYFYRKIVNILFVKKVYMELKYIYIYNLESSDYVNKRDTMNGLQACINHNQQYNSGFKWKFC